MSLQPARPRSLAEDPRLPPALELLRAGRAAEAADRLNELAAAHPESPDANRLLGIALSRSGETNTAETALRRAFALDPRSGPNAVSLAELLLATERPDEALAVVEPLGRSQGADLNVLTVFGEALKALGRLDEAIAVYDRAARAQPASAVAEHNLAAALGDAERYEESAAAALRARSRGLDAPETWLVLARALYGQGRYDESEDAYRAVMDRRPADPDAAFELAQLTWMREGDLGAALAPLDRAIAAAPDAPVLRVRRAELMDFAGCGAEAYASLLETPGVDEDANLSMCAARRALRLDPDRAVVHARRAFDLVPADRGAASSLCEALLAAGQTEEAADLAARLHRDDPLDQNALALLSTAWRLVGDPRYGALHDFETLVRGERIETPAGWPSLEAFLADLATSLHRLHGFRTHPVGQSVRHGSQTSQSLLHSTDPAIRGFLEAVRAPIDRYVQALGEGPDPVRSRQTGRWRFSGLWSILLSPGGYHHDHLHSRGWLSSAFYVALPGAVETSREGWLKFGEPGVPTRPALACQHAVKPQPGLLVLFPSYMWHGTIPFGGEESRLTIAFDLLPD